MMGRKLAFTATAIAALVVSGVEAQVTTNATCLPTYSWMVNSRGQSPCVISGYLSAQCNNGQWNVPAITPDGPQYLPPHDAGANLCRCNTVTYSLLQACSTCQGGTAGTWTDWIFQCPQADVYVQQYPLNIPASVNIPAWAYLNVVPGNKFDVSQANGYQFAPESTGAGSPTNTAITGTRIPTTVGIPSSTHITKPASTSGGSSTNVGAIVGGVIGGLVLLAGIGGLIAFYLRKQKRKNKAASNAFMGGEVAQVAQSPMTTGYPVAPGTPGIKPYDPNDPSTFPVTPAPGYALPYQQNTPSTYPQQPLPGQTNSYYGGSMPDEYNRPATIYSNNQYPAPQQPPPHQTGGYTGAAEL